MNNIPSSPVAEQKSLVVALMGASNVGKSTLVNAMAGSKVSIVTPKVQTTRHLIKAIVMKDQAQLILTDTPGLFEAKRSLERSMVKTAWQGIHEAELLAWVVDAKRGMTGTIEAIQKQLASETRPVILIVNKIDLLSKDALLPLISSFNALRPFDRIFLISALKSEGIEDLKTYLAGQAKPRPWEYNPEELSTMPVRVWVAELVREQLFLRLKQELPYQLTVDTEQFKTVGKNEVRIDATIYVSKDSQKQIILGAKGQTIKQISMQVRKEVEVALEKKVHLFLFVKVRENWFEQPMMYNQMGMVRPD